MVERSFHGYNVLTGFIISLQVAVILLGLEILKDRVNFDKFWIFVFLVFVWIIGEFILDKVYLKQIKRRRKQKMNWWTLIVGFFGLGGVVSQMPKDFGSWVVGLAFLILLISSFFDKK